MLILIVGLTFACIALGVMSLYLLLARPANVVTARLESMDPSLTLIENNPMTTMAERVAEPAGVVADPGEEPPSGSDHENPGVSAGRKQCRHGRPPRSGGRRGPR